MTETLPLALISGGTSGIGLATARRLQDRFRLALLYGRNNDQAARARAELPGSQTYALDLTSSTQLDEVYSQLEKDFATTPQVLVNALEMRNPCRYLVQGLDLQECARVMDVHFFGSLRLAQKVLPGMYRRRSGSIVNLSSISAKGGYKGVIGYAEAKAAVECLTQNLAMEVGHRGIAVNCVSPGLVAHPEAQELQSQFAPSSVNSPLGRYLEPEEVAAVIDFLIESGPAVNGQIVTVDGGTSLAKVQIVLKS